MRGDADTVTAITGQMAGAIYGASSIPKEWIKIVQQWDNGGDIALKAYKMFKKTPLHPAHPTTTPSTPAPTTAPSTATTVNGDAAAPQDQNEN